MLSYIIAQRLEENTRWPCLFPIRGQNGKPIHRREASEQRLKTI
jgi:hypothetical protein